MSELRTLNSNRCGTKITDEGKSSPLCRVDISSDKKSMKVKRSRLTNCFDARTSFVSIHKNNKNDYGISELSMNICPSLGVLIKIIERNKIKKEFEIDDDTTSSGIKCKTSGKTYVRFYDEVFVSSSYLSKTEALKLVYALCCSEQLMSYHESQIVFNSIYRMTLHEFPSSFSDPKYFKMIHPRNEKQHRVSKKNTDNKQNSLFKSIFPVVTSEKTK